MTPNGSSPTSTACSAPRPHPVGLILALGVTGHVLLNKREVAAATAWIAFALIAPVWGALFYFMFGINRVVRRAQKARTARPPRRPAAEHHHVHDLPDRIAALGTRRAAHHRPQGRAAQRHRDLPRR